MRARTRSLGAQREGGGPRGRELVETYWRHDKKTRQLHLRWKDACRLNAFPRALFATCCSDRTCEGSNHAKNTVKDCQLQQEINVNLRQKFDYVVGCVLQKGSVISLVCTGMLR